ncbi:hypothetical protein [Streptomyces nigrescens]
MPMDGMPLRCCVRRRGAQRRMHPTPTCATDADVHDADVYDVSSEYNVHSSVYNVYS